MSGNLKSSLQNPLARARGLGSAKDGTGHWWGMRLSSLALVPLSLWFLSGLLSAILGYGWAGAVAFVREPIGTILMLLFIGILFHHSQQGLQTVIEDYISHHALRLIALLLNSAAHILLGLAALLAVLKIFLAA